MAPKRHPSAAAGAAAQRPKAQPEASPARQVMAALALEGQTAKEVARTRAPSIELPEGQQKTKGIFQPDLSDTETRALLSANLGSAIPVTRDTAGLFTADVTPRHPCVAHGHRCFDTKPGRVCPLANLPAIACPSFLRRGFCDRCKAGKCGYTVHAVVVPTTDGTFSLIPIPHAWQMPQVRRDDGADEAARVNAQQSRVAAAANVAARAANQAAVSMMADAMVQARDVARQNFRASLAQTGAQPPKDWKQLLVEAATIKDVGLGIAAKYKEAFLPQRREKRERGTRDASPDAKQPQED